MTLEQCFDQLFVPFYVFKNCIYIICSYPAELEISSSYLHDIMNSSKQAYVDIDILVKYKLKFSYFLRS